MKKHFVLIVALIWLMASVTYSQESKWKLGVSGSGDLTFIWGNAIANARLNPSVNFSAETNFQYELKPNLFLRSGLTFSRKGAQSKAKITNLNGDDLGEVKVITNFDYLIVPLLIQKNFETKKVDFFINTGIYTGFLLQK